MKPELATMEDDRTIEETYGPAMEMTDQATADAYFEELVLSRVQSGLSREEAERLERGNLGYYAGYYCNEVRERVERLFDCAHPIFGKIAEVGPPRDAFAAGRAMGESFKKQSRDT